MTAATTLPLITETVSPADQAAAAATVRQAFESQTPLYLLGGRTSLEYGLPARRKGLGLSLANLTRLVDYPARDMTITVEAGINMAALAELLAKERQRLPIDAPQAARATLGGVIATNTSGPRRFGCGTIRDYVIGISAVDGRGVPFKAGGRVVKNVAGYDLCKLLCGSLGTLGAIVQVTLKLKPMPAATAFVVCSLPDLADAERLLDGLVRSRVSATAVELLIGPAWQNDAVLGALGDGSAVFLAVGFEGTAAEVAWMQQQLRQEWTQQGVDHLQAVVQEATAGLWSRLTEFPCGDPAMFPGADPAAVTLKANVTPSTVTHFCAKLLLLDPACSIQAHAASGIVVARLSKLPPNEISQALVKQLQPLAMAAGGNIVVLSSTDGVEPTRRVVWGGASADAHLMQAVKDQFDPRGLLNPGRFIYGTA